MASEIATAKDGLATLIGNISGMVQVFDYPPDGVHETPSMVLQFQGRDPQQTIGGSTFLGTLRGTMLINSASNKQAFDKLDEFMEPLGTNSVEAAVDSDNTWGGSVDTGKLTSIENVGFREIGGGRYAGADFVFEFMKGVAS